MKIVIIIVLIALVGGSAAVSKVLDYNTILAIELFSSFIRYQYNQKIYLTILYVTSLQNGF